MKTKIFVWNTQTQRYEERPGFKLEKIEILKGQTHIFLDYIVP